MSQPHTPGSPGVDPQAERVTLRVEADAHVVLGLVLGEHRTASGAVVVPSDDPRPAGG